MFFWNQEYEKAASSGSGVKIDGDEATTKNGSEYGIGLINKVFTILKKFHSFILVVYHTKNFGK